MNPTSTPSKTKRSPALRATALAALTATVTVTLTGCGGGSGETAPSAAPSAPPSQTVPANPSTLASNGTADDINRLRLLGYEVFETPGDTPDPSTLDELKTGSSVSSGWLGNEASGPSSEELRKIQSGPNTRPSIVGGVPAQEGQFPFAVYLVTNKALCSGTLIGAQWVKTANHCIAETLPPTGLTAYVGAVVRGAGEQISSDYYVRIPGADTALVHLSRPSSMTPVAYNGIRDLDTRGPFTLMGYGSLYRGGPSSDLRTVVNTKAELRTQFNQPGMLVVGEPESYQTICFGDSGGPALTYNSSGFPLDIGTLAVTYYPDCTGLSGYQLTSPLAADFERITGIPANQFPTNNAPPTLRAIGTVETQLGDTSVRIEATDAEGDGIAFTATGLPNGLSINAATGTISGTTTEYTVRPLDVVVRATDKTTGAHRSIAFPWRVNTPGNLDPVIDEVSDQVTPAGAQVSLQVTGRDQDGSTIEYSALGLPKGLSISKSGLITGRALVGGNNSVTLVASDGIGGVAVRSMSWRVLNENPVLTPRGPFEFRVPLGAPLSFSIPFETSDADGHPVKVSAQTTLEGVVVDNAARVFRGTLGMPGTHNVPLTADDGFGGTDTKVVTLSISYEANRAPVMEPLVARSDLPGVALSIPINASDPDGHKFAATFRNLPPGIIFDSVNKVLKGTPVKGGSFEVSYFLADVYGGRTTYPTVTWTIPNTPPVVTAPAAQRLMPGEKVNIPFTAADPEGHAFSVTATGLPKGLVANSTTRSITGTVLQSGEFNPVITATDRFGGKSTGASFSITVPNEAPVIVSGPTDMTHVAGTPINIPLDYRDPEGHTMRISVEGLNVLNTRSSLPVGVVLDGTNKRISGTVTRAGTYWVRIKVTDAYGASSFMEPFNWTVTNTAPTLSTVAPPSLKVGSAFDLQLSGSDADGHKLTYVAAGLPRGLAINSATGRISGTPTLAASSSVLLYVRDAYGMNSPAQRVVFTVQP